ncbi:hypothetical protein Mapa_003622 [Marchantia paleacea]|nr:hypothetical protein Mapa_003622 [Marchantia paleacea]
MVITASVCTASHGNYPTRLWHLIVHPGQRADMSSNVQHHSHKLLISPTFRNTILLPQPIENLNFYYCFRFFQLIFPASSFIYSLMTTFTSPSPLDPTRFRFKK